MSSGYLEWTMIDRMNGARLPCRSLDRPAEPRHRYNADSYLITHNFDIKYTLHTPHSRTARLNLFTPLYWLFGKGVIDLFCISFDCFLLILLLHLYCGIMSTSKHDRNASKCKEGRQLAVPQSS